MKPHGEIKLEWQDDLLFVRVAGPFNHEGSIAAIEQFRESIKNSGFTTWYRLEIWGDGAMGTPEALSNSSEVYDWSIDHGCLATAVVINGVFLTSIAQDLLPASVKIFSEGEQALRWIEEQRI